MPIEVIMPQLGESIVEGTLTKWLKNVGDTVVADEPLFEISTDKVDSEIPSPASGRLKAIRVREGETVPVNTVVALIEAGSELIADAHKVPPAASLQKVSRPLPSAPTQPDLSPRSSPLVRRIAREHHADLAGVPGTGLGGRITKKDILDYVSHQEPAPPAPTPLSAPAPPELVELLCSRATPRQIVPMPAMRKKIAEHMLLSRRTAPHATTVFEVDMNGIAQIKARDEAAFQQQTGIKLTYLPFVLKATTEALLEMPVLNASVAGTDIIYKKEINLGVAVALDTGLIVPVIRNAEKRSFAGLALAVADLANRARHKQLLPEEVHHGTFTITNPGVFGSILGMPIIHHPQVAILCLGAITKRAVVINDAIAIRSMVYLTLTFDHRLIDGAIADQFMARIKKKLEAWEAKII